MNRAGQINVFCLALIKIDIAQHDFLAYNCMESALLTLFLAVTTFVICLGS